MLWNYIEQAGPLGYMLIGVSVVSLAVIIERWWFWLWSGRPVFDKTRRIWLEACRNGSLPELKGHSPEARALAYLYGQKNIKDETPLDVAMSREIRNTNRHLSILDNNAAVAPMLGILGTIIGIIQAFAGMKGSVPNTSLMVSGISVAMLTTAIGLIVALQSLLAYNWFADKAYKRQVLTAELLQEAWILLKQK